MPFVVCVCVCVIGNKKFIHFLKVINYFETIFETTPNHIVIQL